MIKLKQEITELSEQIYFLVREDDLKKVGDLLDVRQKKIVQLVASDTHLEWLHYLEQLQAQDSTLIRALQHEQAQVQQTLTNFKSIKSYSSV
ncbi:MAG: hypothetical protein WAW86_01855 [Gammaproteobacteria bacterium]